MDGLGVGWVVAAGWALLGLAGCGSPPAGREPVGAARPGAAGPVELPLRETMPGPPASLDSATGRAVRVVRVQLPNGPRYQVPQVRLADMAVARRINAALLRLVLTDNLDDTTQAATATQALRRARAAYVGSGQVGIFATSYDVLLNRAGLLSLALTVEYSGAYPWAATQHATFEVRTGRLLTLPDLLADTLALRRRWHLAINRRLAAHLRQVRQDYPGDSAALGSVAEHTGWSDSLGSIPPRRLPPLGEFALTPHGLLLYTRFWFPHVALALSPNDEYPFPYARVLPWAGPHSLLRQVRS